MDEWNPLLPQPRYHSAPRREPHYKVAAGIVALFCALGLIAWFLVH